MSLTSEDRSFLERHFTLAGAGRSARKAAKRSWIDRVGAWAERKQKELLLKEQVLVQEQLDELERQPHR